MRTIERSTQFKRDYRRHKGGPRAKRLDDDLVRVITLLANNEILPARYADHPLSGNLRGFRDCHVYPDLILLYEIPDAETLRLVRLGSHSELGL